MRWGQPQRIGEASESVVSAIEENHPAVAKKLRSLTANSHTATVNLAVKVEGLVHFEEAGHGLDAVVLSTTVETECRSIIEEHAMTTFEKACRRVGNRHPGVFVSSGAYSEEAHHR